MKNSIKRKILGMGLLLVSSLSLFAANTSQASGNQANVLASGVETKQQLRCSSQRCKNRQHRRIFRAECRLDGGYAIGWTCHNPAGGN